MKSSSLRLNGYKAIETEYAVSCHLRFISSAAINQMGSFRRSEIIAAPPQNKTF